MPIDGGAVKALEHHLDRVLRVGLDAKPDEVALVSAEDRMTWRELDVASTRLANGYRDLGLERGERIASLMPNRTALAVHYLAAFKAGLVVTPLNYRYAPPEIDHALEVSAASALVAHAERADDLAASPLTQQLPRGVITYGANGGAEPALETLIARAGPETDLGSPDPSAPAAIFFTSGSTGPAKGVTHSPETLGWMTASAIAGLELTDEDVFLPGSSMSHIGSFLWTFATLAAGGQVVVARTYDAHEILPLLREHRPTVLAMIPAALTALIRDHDVTRPDFESLRLCRAGADKVSLELEAEFTDLAGISIDEGYGMTEVGLATLNPPSGVVKKGSIGPPIPGFSISVRDDGGGEVAPGEVGRVWLKTSSHTIGYWENPEATAEIMRDGWLDSGDLVRADDDGYLWFFGRKKQIIVHDGSNISPLEVEGALVEHPDIALCGVVGIRDEVHGENVRAYVTLRPDRAPPSSADLIAFARERVGYKAPEEVMILDEMPLNATGKLDRVGLKRLAEEHLHPHGLDEP